jgi:ATP-binding cassette subfamily B protein
MVRLRAVVTDLNSQMSYLPRALSLVWSASRPWTTAWLVVVVLEGMTPAALVYLTRPLIDAIVSALGAGGSWESISPVLWPAGLMAAVIALSEIVRAAGGWIRTAQAEFIRDYLTRLVHDKSTEIDLGFYESPEFHDRLERTRNDLSSRPLALLESVGSLLQSSITLAAMAILLASYEVWLPWLLLLSAIPAFYVVLHFNRRYHRWWEETTTDRRMAQYYDTLLTHSTVAPELRIFDLGDFLKNSYQSLRGRMRGERIKFAREQGLARFLSGLAGAAISGIAIAWIVWRGAQGRATLGDLALIYQAIQRGQGLFYALLENIGQIYSNTLFLGNLFEFLELKATVTDPDHPIKARTAPCEAIRFDRVGFSYPGSDRPVLRDFDLVIPAGQIVAIVGSNGAGKSTLLKLLCRFYDAQSGTITLDGQDIRDFELKSYRRLLTVLLQSPVLYQTTASQNIVLGDLAANRDAHEIEAVARAAGIHDRVAQLPAAYGTQLGKWFASGVELSVGEWQKLALARAFFRKAPIILLDEPTSALDSWAEADWFERFRSLAQGRTAIIITHRFTIARRADMIHVMDAGRIVESGNHHELLAQHGFYAQSWAAQMEGRVPSNGQAVVAESGVPSHGNGSALL